jgi:hypothetical protein
MEGHLEAIRNIEMSSEREYKSIGAKDGKSLRSWTTFHPHVFVTILLSFL